MKRRFLRLLARAGLIGPAFRTYERVVSLRPGRPAAVDGPPLPPRRLMVRVAGTADADWFLRSGRAAYDAIVAHVPLAEVDSVLDFGCGCGRVTRYWGDFEGTVSGSSVILKVPYLSGTLDVSGDEMKGVINGIMPANVSLRRQR